MKIRILIFSILLTGLIPYRAAAQNIPDEPPFPCLTLVGDSVPHGDVVYQVPGHGFAILRTEPFSRVLARQLEKQDFFDIDIRDRSASAAFLSELGKNPYAEMPAYTDLLQDKCTITIIMPWINDMSVDLTIPPENRASTHITDLQNLVQTLHDGNPEGHILIVGFYYGQRADFVEKYSAGYTPENIEIFNQILFTACESDGLLGQISGVRCLDSAPLFEGLSNAHVVLDATQEEVMAILYEPIPDDVRPFFDVYWQQNPDARVIGDGVHLSEAGKIILADALIAELQPELAHLIE